MSEEHSESKPPKLKLSRKLNEEQTNREQDKPKPELKLKRPVEREETQSSGTPPRLKRPEEKEPKDSSAEASAPKLKRPEASDIADETKPGAKPEASVAFDKDNPFKDILPEQKTKRRDQPPPELPSKPAPVIEDGSSEKLEEAISSIAEEKKSHNLILSIVIILILLGILGGSGYGLWYVLRAPSGNSPKETSAGLAPSKEAAQQSDGLFSNAVAKAKETIAKVEDAAVDEALDMKAAPAVPDAPPPPVQEKTETTETALPEENFEPPPPQSGKMVDQALVGVVSEYLASIHIGGVRTGERPKVIIEGVSYEVGDLLVAETGLRFAGLRNGKLAFKDENGVVYLKSF